MRITIDTSTRPGKPASQTPPPAEPKDKGIAEERNQPATLNALDT